MDLKGQNIIMKEGIERHGVGNKKQRALVKGQCIKHPRTAITKYQKPGDLKQKCVGLTVLEARG